MKPDEAASPSESTLFLSSALGLSTCIDCEYDLRGLTVERCPECGLPFDGSVRAALALRRGWTEGPRARSKKPSWLVGIVLASTLVPIVYAVRASHDVLEDLIAGPVLAGLLIGLFFASQQCFASHFPRSLRPVARGIYNDYSFVLWSPSLLGSCYAIFTSLFRLMFDEVSDVLGIHNGISIIAMFAGALVSVFGYLAWRSAIGEELKDCRIRLSLTSLTSMTLLLLLAFVLQGVLEIFRLVAVEHLLR